MKILGVYVVSVIYSLIRYVAFTPDNVSHIPLFVMNKGISMGAAFCIVTAYVIAYQQQRATVSESSHVPWFRAGSLGLFFHIPVSILLIRPEYFEEFFLHSGRMNFYGEIVLMLGVLSTICVYLLSKPSWKEMQRWYLSLIVMSGLVAHTLFMGLARGISLSAKRGYLPPMWLLSLIALSVGLIFLLMSKPDREAPDR